MIMISHLSYELQVMYDKAANKLVTPFIKTALSVDWYWNKEFYCVYQYLEDGKLSIHKTIDVCWIMLDDTGEESKNTEVRLTKE